MFALDFASITTLASEEFLGAQRNRATVQAGKTVAVAFVFADK